MLSVSSATGLIKGNIHLPVSKSIVNRLLLLQGFAGQPLFPQSEEDSDDIRAMRLVIESVRNNTGAAIDIGAAGTAMRFATVFLSMVEGTRILKGSERMHGRPIGPLVEAIRQLGGDITYLEKEGFPPLRIKGKNLKGRTISIDASVSSQFASALLMAAPFIKNGLTLQFENDVVSASYIDMSCRLLEQSGVSVNRGTTRISVKELSQPVTLATFIEADWSAASYLYLICALHKNASIMLPGLTTNSLQGDSILPKLFAPLGVETINLAEGIEIRSTKPQVKLFHCDCINFPDLAQTLAVACFGLGIDAHLTGLQTLVHKETNRLAAMKTELEKFGAQVKIGPDSLVVLPGQRPSENSITVSTYNDHRMAMSLAPLCLLGFELNIENETVVDKSYPHYWQDLKALGFNVNLQP